MKYLELMMQNNEVLQKKLFDKYGIALSSDDPAWFIYQIHSDLTEELYEMLEKIEHQKEDIDITNIKSILDDFTIKNTKILRTYLEGMAAFGKNMESYLEKFTEIELNIESRASAINSLMKTTIFDTIAMTEEHSNRLLKNIDIKGQELVAEIKEQINIDDMRRYRQAMIESRELMLNVKSRRKIDAIFFTLFGAIFFYLTFNIFGFHTIVYELIYSFVHR